MHTCSPPHEDEMSPTSRKSRRSPCIPQVLPTLLRACLMVGFGISAPCLEWKLLMLWSPGKLSRICFGYNNNTEEWPARIMRCPPENCRQAYYENTHPATRRHQSISPELCAVVLSPSVIFVPRAGAGRTKWSPPRGPIQALVSVLYA